MRAKRIFGYAVCIPPLLVVVIVNLLIIKPIVWFVDEMIVRCQLESRPLSLELSLEWFAISEHLFQKHSKKNHAQKSHEEH